MTGHSPTSPEEALSVPSQTCTIITTAESTYNR